VRDLAPQRQAPGEADGRHERSIEQGPESTVHPGTGRHGGGGEQNGGPPLQHPPPSRDTWGDEQDQCLQREGVQRHIPARAREQGVAAGQRDPQEGEREEGGQDGGGAAPPQADQHGQEERRQGALRERVRHIAGQRDRVRVELEAPGISAGLPVRADEDVSGHPEAVPRARVQEFGQLQQQHEQREQHAGQGQRVRPGLAVRTAQDHPDPDPLRGPQQVKRFTGAGPALAGLGSGHQHTEDLVLVAAPVRRWVPAQQPPVPRLKPVRHGHARFPVARCRSSRRLAATAALCCNRSTSAASRSPPS